LGPCFTTCTRLLFTLSHLEHLFTYRNMYILAHILISHFSIQYGRSTEVLETNLFCEKNNILPKQINHLMSEYGNFKGLGHEIKFKMFDTNGQTWD
jgi:hypothetical protein